LTKFCWSCLRTGFYVVILLSTALAIYTVESTNADWATREIQKLKAENRRDEAIDLVKFLEYQKGADYEELQRMKQELEYSVAERFKSAIWNGMTKGEVYDHYSGLGATIADICLWGDVRDVGIQVYKYIAGESDNDNLVMLLSGAGIGFTCFPMIDGTSALAKNTAKYLKSISTPPANRLLRQFISGDLSPINRRKIWELFKKTTGPSPEPHPLSPTFPT
jgi:hypothetical protein